MSVLVSIVDGPLKRRAPAWTVAGAGAIVVFEGIVRGVEDGRAIAALEYEAYRPMADRMLAELGGRVIASYGVLGVCVEHSRGRVGVGECSFRLAVAGAHRKEALAAMDWFIDALKRDVPIWKRAVGATSPADR